MSTDTTITRWTLGPDGSPIEGPTWTEDGFCDPISLTSDLEQMARWVLGLPVDDFRVGFTVRACHVMREHGVDTLGALVRLTPDDVLRMRVGSRKVLEEVERVLAEMGLGLADPDFPDRADG